MVSTGHHLSSETDSLSVGEKFEDLAEGGDDEADIDDQYKHHLEYSLKLVTKDHSCFLALESEVDPRVL